MKNWPADFLSRAKEKFKDDFEAFLESLETVAPVSVRMNPAKPTARFSGLEEIKWSSNGFYLAQRPSFTLDPLFHAGCYYVQEASSQFLEFLFVHAIAKNESPTILDLCGAPGGKSTHLLSLLNNRGVLVSNEVIPSRNKILQENVAKWGLSNVVITQNESKVFGRLKNVFDVIVVDAPCSGEGLFRRDPEAANEWSVDAVNNCSRRQTSILSDVVECLKPGGYLIYSTCTFESAENEEQVKALAADGEFEIINLSISFEGIETNGYGYSFYPHKVKGEGFFISLLRKRSEEVFHSVKPTRPKRASGKLPVINLTEFVDDVETIEVFSMEDKVWLYMEQVSWFIRNYGSALYVRNAGVFAGTNNRGELLPSHELALSCSLSKNIPSVDLSLEESISYLRSETNFKVQAKAGWNVVRYESYPLGWIKVLPNRFNNYYPKELRIRMK